jgi:menaquinone-dependent protoporphyrinogen IX oxidase
MSAAKTLIAYISKCGATEEAARKIAEILRLKFQLEVNVVDLKKQNPSDLSLYQNIIVSAGVRGGKVYSKALKFLENDLSGKKDAFLFPLPGLVRQEAMRTQKLNLWKKPLLNIPRLIL